MSQKITYRIDIQMPDKSWSASLKTWETKAEAKHHAKAFCVKTRLIKITTTEEVL